MKQVYLGIVSTAMFFASVTAGAESEAVNVNEIVGTVCATCHGEDGNKMLTPETPKLGGQHGDYLAKALGDYRSGARSNPLMSAVATNLTDAQIEALAAYFASQKSDLHTLK